MKITGLILAILAGYSAMSFGVMKILWRIFGAHFYEPGVSHAVESTLLQDLVLINTLFVAGIFLILNRAVIFSILLVMAIYTIEFTYFHSGHHELWQVTFVVGSLAFQFTTLIVNLVSLFELNQPHEQYHS